ASSRVGAPRASAPPGPRGTAVPLRGDARVSGRRAPLAWRGSAKCSARPLLDRRATSSLSCASCPSPAGAHRAAARPAPPTPRDAAAPACLPPPRGQTASPGGRPRGGPARGGTEGGRGRKGGKKLRRRGGGGRPAGRGGLPLG